MNVKRTVIAHGGDRAAKPVGSSELTLEFALHLLALGHATRNECAQLHPLPIGWCTCLRHLLSSIVRTPRRINRVGTADIVRPIVDLPSITREQLGNTQPAWRQAGLV